MICVNSIKITPNSIRLQTGKWYNSATVEISPANATCKSVTWSSSNSDIASVNPISGQVLANATGTATIVATACDESGKKGSYVVTVTDDILVTSVTVYPAKKTMDVGDSCYLNASVGPANAANRCVCWHSSNTNVASVGLWSGCVTAVGTGTATIYATACDGSRVFDGCEVTVGRYYKLINKNNSKALSVSGEYLLDLKKERELCLKEQGDPNEQVWRVSRVSAQDCCWVKSFINESYVLSITTENKCSVMASSSAKAVLFVPQGNEYYRIKCSENELYLTSNSSGDGVCWSALSDNDLQLWRLCEVDLEQREAEKVEYFILGNAGDGDALRVGEDNHLAMMYKDQNKKVIYRDHLKVFTKKKSFWNRQKWTIRGTGAATRIKTQLTDDKAREFFLCLQNESEAFVSCLATDEDSYLQIISYDASHGLFRIKLASQDLYLTCSGNNVLWQKYEEKGNSQIWKFETKPEYIHNGADIARKLYTAEDNETVDEDEKEGKSIIARAFKLGKEEFVVRYYCHDNTARKAISRKEKDLLHELGIKIVVVFQDIAQEEEHFKGMGTSDAAEALAMAELMNQPENTPIYFAVDTNFEEQTVRDTICTYFADINAKFKTEGKAYKVGVYGSGLVCRVLKEQKLVEYTWLCHSTSYYEYNEYDSPNKYNIKQADYVWHHKKFDDCVGVGDDYGQW